MDNAIQLTPEEEKQLQEGQALYEMTKSQGFAVLERWLQDLAYHSWVDPRDVKDKTEWEWRELNAYHAANAARELMESIQKAISDSDYLHKVKTGAIQRKRMVI